MPQVVAAALGSFALSATAGTSLAFSAAAFSAATAVGYGLGTVALVAGPSLLLKALSPTGGGGINTPEARGSIRQATPAQRVCYGYCRTGGAAFFMDDSKPPYLYVGLLISARRISEFTATYIGTNRVQFDNTRAVTNGDYISAGGAPRMWLSTRDGATDQAIDPILAADFANLDAEFRQRGIAAAVAKFHFGADADEHQALWGNVQIPNLLLDVKGAPIYDPRDPTQDVDDPSTWKFSNNASLVIADYLRASYGGRIASDRMRWDEIAAEADYDTAPVGRKDGDLEARHTIDGVITLDQTPYDVVQGMLSANRGFVVQAEGRVSLAGSRPLTPTVTITDRLIAGGFDYRGQRPRRELLNKVRTRFVAPDREYQVVDGPVLVDTDLEEADGETLEGSLSLPFTRGHQRAQRLGFAAREESRIGRALSVPVKLDVLEQGAVPEAGTIVLVQSTRFQQINGIYALEQIDWADDFSQLQFALAEYDKTIDARWLPATMEQDFTLSDLDVS